MRQDTHYLLTKNTALTVLSLLVCLLHFSACPQTTVSGNQSGTWTKTNSPYALTGPVTVLAGQTLVIEAGVSVQFPRRDYHLHVRGTLKAEGTDADSIRFLGKSNTSLSGSSHGGTIYFYNTGTNSVLDRVVVDSLGDVNTTGDGAINIQTLCSIKNSRIRNSEDIGVYITGNAAPEINNCSFTGSPKSIYSPSIKGLVNVSNNANAAIYISSSTVDGSITLKKQGTNAYYIFNTAATVTVAQNQTLTIEPGAEIRSQHYGDQIQVNGTLIARGTATDSIRFVGLSNATYTNSSHGGYIFFTSSSRNSVLEYTSFDRWGDQNYPTRGDLGVLYVGTPSFSLSKSTVRNSEGRGLYINSSYADSAFAISDNKFVNNGTVDIDCYASQVDGFSNNQSAQIRINGSTINRNVTWHKPGPNSYYAFHSSGSIVTVSQNQTLTIEAGAEIRSQNYADQIQVNGTLIARGTATDSIRFVGLANPSSSYPASTHGGNINFSSQSRNSVLEYTSFDRWGDKDYFYRGDQGVLYVGAPSFSMSKSTLRNSEGTGLYISSNYADSAFTISDNKFSNNGTVDIDCYASHVDGFSNNQGARIRINSSTINRNVTWRKPGPNSYYIFYPSGSTVTVSQNQTLIIEPGAEIRSQNYSDQIQVNGTLIARGTATDSIRFVGVPNSSNPASTHGGNINFSSQSRNSALEYTSFDRWGDKDYFYRGDQGVLYVGAPSFSLSKSTVRNSEGTGLYINSNYSDSVFAISDNKFGNNGVVDIDCYASHVDGFSNNQSAQIRINSSTVKRNTTWRKPGLGSYYAFHSSGSTVTVSQNQTLTIEAGAEIRSQNYADQIQVNGTLIARGTATDSIRFVGLANPSSSYPASTHGGNINFSSQSRNSALEYTSFDRWGDKDYFYRGDQGALYVGAPSFSMSKSTLHNSEGTGLYINSNYADSVFTISDNEFSNSGFSDIDCYASHVDGFSNNQGARIRINSSTINRNVTWHKPGPNSYYTFSGSGSTITVSQNQTLIIEPGAEIRSQNYSDQIQVNGTLVARGTATDSVRFVGLANSSNPTSSTHGGNIFFSSLSRNSFLEYVSFDRWGDKDYFYRGDQGVVYVGAPSFSLSKSSIRNGEGIGLYYAATGTSTVSSTTFSKNTTGVYVSSGSPVFSNCNITGNTLIGMNNTGSGEADARYCWWGHNNGPKHPALNPNGLGDSVSNKVLFIPWRSQPVDQISDIGISDILTPTSDCRLTGTETVKVKIKNFGSSNYTGFDVSYRINAGTAITENVGSLTLPPAASVDYSFTTKANLSAAGTYTIKAYTTSSLDSIRNNDTASATVQHTQTLTAPSNLLPADGTANLSPPVNFSWSGVQAVTGYDLYVWKASDTVPATPVAANLTQINFSYTSGTLVYGTTYKWKVMAKNATCQTESGIQTFALRNLPDLTVSQITVPPTATSESDIAFSWKVTNQGPGSTGATQWYETVYLTESLSNPSGGIVVGSFTNFSALGAGQSYTHPTQTFRIPQGTQGQYYIVIKTDAYNGVLESVDTNNTAVSAPIAISLAPPPDLQVKNLVVAPTTAFSEDSLSVGWTVKNLGTGPTTATSWTDVVYFSKDSVLNTGTATFLGQVNRGGGLNVNEEYTRSVKYKIPAKIEGVYYVYIFTDRYSQVFEYVKEDNNVGTSGALQIILRPAPNLVISSVSVPYDTVTNKQNLSVQWIAKNEGAVPAKPVWYDNIRLTSDTFYTSSGYRDLGTYAHNDTLQSLSATGAQKSIQLPYDLAEGKYYVFVKADSYDYIFEGHNENDNLSAYAGPLYAVNPDLTPALLQAPATVQTRQAVTVSWTVENAGKGAVYNAAWVDYVYLSADTVLGSGDVELASVTNNAFVSSGGQYTKQQAVTIPEGIQGNYHLIVVVNYSNSVFEKSSTNNRIYIPVSITLSPWADLVVSSIQGPAIDTAGTPINFSYTVKNAGTARIDNKSWTDRLYLSPTNNINDPNRIYLQQTSNQRSLDTGQSYTVAVTAQLPSSISGQYYLLAVTDEYNGIFESTGENNNRKLSAPITVSAFPSFDLTAVSATVNANALIAGQAVAVDWTGKNASPIATIVSSWEDAVYLSTNTVLDAGDRLLGAWTVNTPLAPNASYNQGRTVTIPNDANGTYYLLVNIDRTNQHNDSSRNNNTLVLSKTNGGTDGIVISLPAPSDLLPTAMNAPAEGAAAQPFTFSYTVKNNGTGNTNAANWTDRLFLSSDLQLGSGDLLIGSFNHSGVLAPGAQYADTQQVFVPANASGNYFLIFKTDADNGVYEYNAEANNTSFSSIFINPQPPSDLLVTDITPPAGMQTAGRFITVKWTLKNVGANPLKGYFRDAVYLSTDTTWDVGDVLFGTKDTTLNGLGQQASLTRQLTQRLTNVARGEYYVILRTDILNNQLEADETNNLTCSASAMPVEVQLLTMGTPASDSLTNTQSLYYRINIPASQAGETMLLSLYGDPANNAVNKLFLSHNKVPTANQYDFASQVPFSASQEVVVPELKEGTYYLLAAGDRTTYQRVTLLAKLIPFEITSVESAKGGNTGAVTLRIKGAKFTTTTSFKLQSNSLGTLLPVKVYYTDQTQVYATFNLLNAKTGLYNLVATQSNGDSTRLTNGFAVVQGPGSTAGSGSGSPGSGTGFVCQVVNIGFDDGLDIGLAYPGSTRINQYLTITIYFENKGTVDIPAPTRYFISSNPNVPVGLTLDDLTKNYKDLVLDFKEPAGPPGILRPGANGFIKVYTRAVASGSLDYVIVE